MVLAHTVSPFQKSSGVVEPESLAMRYLPPGKLIDLYMAYVAQCGSDAHAASLSTFRRVWKSTWRKCLRFRKSSTHAECRTCSMLKHQIKTACDLTSQALASSQLLRHLRAQWADRSIYWGLRHVAKTQFSIVSLIRDGMDHSKFSLPRCCVSNVEHEKHSPMHMYYRTRAMHLE
jgi:hypothetical protein